MAQIDLRGTRADTAIIGREAEVAAGIELGIERRTRAGNLLQYVADRGQAGAFDGLAGDRLYRHLAFDFGPFNA